MLLHVHSVQPRLAVGAVALQGSLLGGHAQWLGLVLQPRHDALEQLQLFLKAPAVEGNLAASMPRAALFPKTPGGTLGPACSCMPAHVAATVVNCSRTGWRDSAGLGLLGCAWPLSMGEGRDSHRVQVHEGCRTPA